MRGVVEIRWLPDREMSAMGWNDTRGRERVILYEEREVRVGGAVRESSDRRRRERREMRAI